MNATTVRELRKFVVPEIIFGWGARQHAARFAQNLGISKPLVVSDAGVADAGWTAALTADLGEAGLPFAVYTEVTPNPRSAEVMRGAQCYAEQGCDGIIALGGGSPLDCAKGIGIVSTNGRHILDFEGVDEVTAPIPPLICIPTTGGTSADVSQFAIINNEDARTKIAVISKAVVPDVALVDPETLTSMPPYLTACTAIDALVHAIEAFVSNAHSPLTDIHALEAMRLISGNIEQVMAHPDDPDLRSRIMLGSLEAGMAFSNASLGATHAMAHSLGGFLDLPHGECNALLLEHVIAFNHAATPERYARAADALGLDVRGMNLGQRRGAILGEVHRLRRAIGVDRTLAAVGVHRTDVPDLARNAIKDPCMITNPRRPNQRDIEVIYEEAL